VIPGVFGAGFESFGPAGLLELPHATVTTRTSIAADRRTCMLVMNLILSPAISKKDAEPSCGQRTSFRG